MSRGLRICHVPGCPGLGCTVHARRPFGQRRVVKPQRLSSAQWDRVVAFVLIRDGGVCGICGKAGADTADHKIALALGGVDDLNNLQAAHRKCNQEKAGREAHESRRYREMVQ